MGGHRDQEDLWFQSADLHSDGSSLEIADPADFVPREQFVTADMDVSQHDDRAAIVDRLDGPSCEI